MTATVDALLPLSFLEGVRNVDSPDDDLETELTPEFRNKRLGLTDTVYAQIRRYSEAVRRHQRLLFDEAAAIATLIGRRPDAARVFRAAGRYLAHQTYQSIAAPTRGLIASLPAFVSRPMAMRQSRRIVKRYLDGTLQSSGMTVMLAIPHSATVHSAPTSAGCVYYEAFLQELLTLLGARDGQVEHIRCVSRGDGACEWRTEWRLADRAEPEVARHSA